MFALLAAASLQASRPIWRDSYGVPHIVAASASEAWFLAGKATAQDRLWQMELSRRIAEGRMSEVFGGKYVAADTETLESRYSDSEFTEQYEHLGRAAKLAVSRYADGVNASITEGMKLGTLPKGYEANGFLPRPWTPQDTVAIAVSLFQRFGKGASGQLRNLAAITYLKSQPALSPNAQHPTLYLDAFDDLAWWNDPAAPTTVQAEDDMGSGKGLFFQPRRADTERQLKALPQLGLFDLQKALRAVDRPAATELAASMGAPFKVGSYAIVVSPKRSSSAKALLLSGPQMGFSNPSVVHEMAISAPGIEVTGMDVPGVPGVLVGATPHFAWGLTSGVADTDDVFSVPDSGPLANVEFELPIKAQAPGKVVQERTLGGVVIIHVGKTLMVRRAAYRMRELKAFEGLLNLYVARTPSQIEQAIRPAPMSFNFFYATTSGHTGYVYIGDVPIRAKGIDPRLPTPYSKANEWQGMIPKDRMPHVRDPKWGLITNWNTKPVTWWPNEDTPVWGEIDHVTEIRGALGKARLGPEDLRAAASLVTTRDESRPFFNKYTPAVSGISGIEVEPSVPIQAWLNSLRHLLFAPVIGTFLNEDLFRIAIQPTLLLRAMQGKTRINFLAGRSADEVSLAAVIDARKAKPTPQKDEIQVPGAAPILHRNRGTFIQIVELSSPPKIQTILPPGEAESGPHQIDQAELARQFQLKPMPWHQR